MGEAAEVRELDHLPLLVGQPARRAPQTFGPPRAGPPRRRSARGPPAAPRCPRRWPDAARARCCAAARRSRGCGRSRGPTRGRCRARPGSARGCARSRGTPPGGCPRPPIGCRPCGRRARRPRRRGGRRRARTRPRPVLDEMHELLVGEVTKVVDAAHRRRASFVRRRTADQSVRRRSLAGRRWRFWNSRPDAPPGPLTAVLAVGGVRAGGARRRGRERGARRARLRRHRGGTRGGARRDRRRGRRDNSAARPTRAASRAEAPAGRAATGRARRAPAFPPAGNVTGARRLRQAVRGWWGGHWWTREGGSRGVAPGRRSPPRAWSRPCCSVAYLDRRAGRRRAARPR